MEPQLLNTQTFKRKRTKRPRSASPLDLTMASASYSSGTVTTTLSANSMEMDTNSIEFDKSQTQVDEDMANCLILLAQGQAPKVTDNPFECKTCNRCFSSFQALGGHRASHRRPKIISEEKKAVVDHRHNVPNMTNNTTSSNANLSLDISSSISLGGGKSKVHECSICSAEFSSGQALGGHMRRHRVVPVGTSSNNDHQLLQLQGKKQRDLLSLDLNLPAPEDDCGDQPKFNFSSKDQVIMFSASTLVDCHY